VKVSLHRFSDGNLEINHVGKRTDSSMTDSYSLTKLILGEIAAAVLLFGFLIIFRQYHTKKYRPSLYLSIAWLGFCLEAAFGSTSLAFERGSISELIFLKLSYTSLIPGFLGVLALIDSISRDSIEPKRFTLVVFVLGCTSIVIWFPLDPATMMISYYIVVGIGFVISIATLVLYINIYFRVPMYLKKLEILNCIGSFFVSVLYVILNIMETSFQGNFPPVSRLFEAIGALIQSIIFSRYEQLFYVLPFKAQRIIVYDTNKGLSCFTHEWSKQDSPIDEDVFTSILHGMSEIVNESLKKGNVLEIKLEQGMLLVSHDNVHTLACVLIASKSSQVLRDGLADFARRFIAKYEKCIDGAEYPEILEGADDLVKSCFPFIPQF